MGLPVLITMGVYMSICVWEREESVTLRESVCVWERERESVHVWEREWESGYKYITHYMNISQQVNSRLTARTWFGSAALAVAVALPV